MQYLVSFPVPGDVMIVVDGKPRLNPKDPSKSRKKLLQEVRDMTSAITNRFPTVEVLKVTSIFALIETTEETAEMIQNDLGYVVAPNRSLRR